MRRTTWHIRQHFSRPLHPHLRFNSTTTPNNELSPVLLTRARSIAAEHASLTSSLSSTFSQSSARKLGQLSHTTTALRAYESALTSHTELQSLLSDPTTDPDLRSLAEEDLPSSTTALSTAAASLRRSLVPPHPFAHLPCLLEIRPGAGGSEAALFAGDLVRMYTAFLAGNGMRYEVLKYEDANGPSDPKGSDAPLAECILEVLDEGAYGRLRGESGVHRVQRVPATESKGRTHTSSAAVMVLPAFEEEGGSVEELEEAAVEEKDVRVDIMRARGAGGQHVNTTNSAVRLTHVPTGTVVAIQDMRSQHKNKEKAWRLLRAKVAQMRREEKEAEMLKLRRGTVAAGKIGREHKVRTYNYGQQRVTDHRSGVSVHDLDDVVEGGEGLERLMESVRGWLSETEVMALAAEEEEGQKEK
ncbi:peptide chain release factor 1 [Elsinoe australis]|uniref:Peptide chain release factor 1 n=1 Tax=Elsinoe australis TaxID=40998 RepID=A0A4U7AUA7_9PEZI|nr:peptide chain release factor 1 [Elsinoe australis]